MVKSFTQFVIEGTANSTLETAKQIILGLRSHGFQGYLVGGCVRDLLMNVQPHDFDVATDARPDEVTAIFPDSKLVGQAFGVVVVSGIDVATFRKDGVYTDGRRPDEVHFAKTPQEDAARRDFTWNALFMDPFTGDILDFFGGQDDLRNKILKTVGSADERFQQDHLRVLRAVRFAGRFGFSIHPDTEAAMTAYSGHLANIDVERITQELIKAMAHDPFYTVTSMKKTSILKTIMPEVDQLLSADHSVLEVLKQVGTHTTTEFGFSALLFKLHAPVIETLCRRLKMDNDLRTHILGVTALQARIATANHHQTMDVLKKLMRDKYFPDALKLFGFRVHVGDMAENAVSFHFLTNLYAGMKHEDLFPIRLMTGDDLVNLGMKAGPQFKDILNAVEIGQLDGSIKTKEQAFALVQKMRQVKDTRFMNNLLQQI